MINNQNWNEFKSNPNEKTFSKLFTDAFLSKIYHSLWFKYKFEEDLMKEASSEIFIDFSRRKDYIKIQKLSNKEAYNYIKFSLRNKCFKLIKDANKIVKKVDINTLSLSNNKTNREEEMINQTTQEQIDAIRYTLNKKQKEIIDVREEHSQITNEALMKKIGVAESTFYRRLRKLKDKFKTVLA